MLSIRYLPLTLFILLLAADQLTRIPAVKEAGRPDATPVQNMAGMIKMVFNDYKNSEKQKPMVLILGSSRSKLFQYLTPGLIEKESKKHQRALLSSYYWEARFAVLRSDAFLMLVYLNEVLKAEKKPDKIVLEFSPELLNRYGAANMESHFHPNVFSQSFLLKLFPEISGPLKQEVFARLLFHSYSVKFRPDRALTNALEGRTAEQSETAAYYYMGKSPVKNLPDGFKDVDSENISEKDYQARFIKYNTFLLKDLALEKYSADPSEKKSYILMMKLLKQQGIPAAIWIPRVHSTVLKIWEEKGLNREIAFIKEAASEMGIRVVDMNESSRCTRFMDSSHHSYRCGPDVAYQILTKGFADGRRL